MVNKFKITYMDDGKEKVIVLKSTHYKKRGTTFIFYDDQGQYLQEFEKKDVRDILPIDHKKL